MPTPRDLIAAAAGVLKERVEEVNRLNVFPVPDGDTGTNMSLTMSAVVSEVNRLSADASLSDVCKAVTHGSLMGARGNSGVILSQILRGICEGIDGAEAVDAEVLATALERGVTVSYQAVRKPVEGTMLTVVKDTACAARTAADAGDSIEDALHVVATAAFESVKRTPELLPVLKENGVVDAGGFGLAILLEGLVAAARNEDVVIADVSSAAAPLLTVQPVDDWDDDEYLYCTEFLLFSEMIDKEAVHDYLADVGGSELIVGDAGEYKVHVHTNDPGAVLTHVTSIGQVAEVHINNMRRQQAARDEDLRHEDTVHTAPAKDIGFVAVAAGDGMAAILRSLGVDEVVSGGQTMNPSTQDLVHAISRVNAHQVVVLPNNKNIIMAANAAAGVADRPVAVVPTRSIPQAFSAMLGFEGQTELDELVATMTELAEGVTSGEVTTAVKDAVGKAGQIKAGQVIGIVNDDEIEAVGDSVDDVASRLATKILAEGAETLTLFAGDGYSDEQLDALAARLGDEHPDVEVETHRGDQPLYPIVMSAE